MWNCFFVTQIVKKKSHLIQICTGVITLLLQVVTSWVKNHPWLGFVIVSWWKEARIPQGSSLIKGMAFFLYLYVSDCSEVLKLQEPPKRDLGLYIDDHDCTVQFQDSFYGYAAASRLHITQEWGMMGILGVACLFDDTALPLVIFPPWCNH